VKIPKSIQPAFKIFRRFRRRHGLIGADSLQEAELVFTTGKAGLLSDSKALGVIRLWARQMRIHQWAKNLLLFVPILASFRVFQVAPVVFLSLGLSFVSFCLVSSAVYVCNDLVDRASDRAHPIKCNRPIAAGLISVSDGVLVAVVLALVGLVIGFLVGIGFFIALVVYLGLTFGYTFWLKRIALVDCISLAGLYTIRVVAGGFASAIEVSFWLLAFSVFFFLSLAYLKRYAELEATQKSGETKAAGRGYLVSDMPLILVFGAGSAFLAVLIFALYLDSAAIRETYAVPQVGWLAIPFLMYLIGRMWFKAHRGEMNQDPVLFLFRDWPSLATVALMGASLVLAHIGFRL
jgi:4-hydroxybenzoate polyprenyltransferase